MHSMFYLGTQDKIKKNITVRAVNESILFALAITHSPTNFPLPGMKFTFRPIEGNFLL